MGMCALVPLVKSKGRRSVEGRLQIGEEPVNSQQSKYHRHFRGSYYARPSTLAEHKGSANR
eukprot:157381-Prorocentrum_minimum.AAC.1